MAGNANAALGAQFRHNIISPMRELIADSQGNPDNCQTVECVSRRPEHPADAVGRNLKSETLENRTQQENQS
jgi:hypothetical protein